MRHLLTFVLALLWLPGVASAQAANDECENAIPISNVSNWCSGVGQYSNATATAMKRDIGGLFGKIARKVDVAAANDDVANLYTTELYQQVRNGGFSCSSE